MNRTKEEKKKLLYELLEHKDKVIYIHHLFDLEGFDLVDKWLRSKDDSTSSTVKESRDHMASKQ